ncbi:MAG: sigma-70 family RNA polymerase sigma factor [Pirellulaceae bacterium]|nr:sigma-70 family RNA polymerase sigma factor [Planctomycetales bacterium]
MDAKFLFEILVRENAKMLIAYIRAAVSDHALADDIWQETMLVAWRRLEEFDRNRPFAPWLRGIAARTIIARRRTASRLVTLENAASLEHLGERLERVNSLKGDTLDEKLDALRDCVARLSDSDRQCIELRFLEGLKPAELSQRLNLALETIKKRLARAKQRIHDCMQQKLQDAGVA